MLFTWPKYQRIFDGDPVCGANVQPEIIDPYRREPHKPTRCGRAVREFGRCCLDGGVHVARVSLLVERGQRSVLGHHRAGAVRSRSLRIIDRPYFCAMSQALVKWIGRSVYSALNTGLPASP